jgi:hypothetical protein
VLPISHFGILANAGLSGALNLQLMRLSQ